ncbi:MAG: hypothetical protein ACOYJC_05990 [Christensenellales bacterium]|jgi:energy-coupling factor transport system substrate-specific component
MQNKVDIRMGISKYKVWAALLILVCIPAVLALGILVLGNQNYYLISVIVIILAIGAVTLVFEGRKPQAKEVVIIAVLVAMSVGGRAAFFILPQFKPVVAMVIIAAVCLGSETGFIVGILAGFISNFIFGQGPATPFQMFGFGIIGFLAGVLFQSGLLKKTRLSLCLYGGLATLVIYGGLLDTCALLMSRVPFSWPALLVYFGSGFAFNVIHAAATVIFLLLLAKPMIEKIDRVKTKFGLLDPSYGKKAKEAGASKTGALRSKKKKAAIAVMALIAAGVVFLIMATNIPGFYGTSQKQYASVEEMQSVLPESLYMPDVSDCAAEKLAGMIQWEKDGVAYYIAENRHTDPLSLPGVQYLNIMGRVSSEADSSLMENASYNRRGAPVSKITETFQANETRTPGIPLTTKVYANIYTFMVGDYTYILESQFFVAAGDEQSADINMLNENAADEMDRLADSIIDQHPR